jgi:hypothetical protein
VFAYNLLRLEAFDALRPSIPRGHFTGRREEKNRIVGYLVDQESKIGLTKEKRQGNLGNSGLRAFWFGSHVWRHSITAMDVVALPEKL